MQKRQLGKSDIFISPLTLGSMSLPLDEKNATNMIDYALDSGINHIDTADLYNFGENEKMLGNILKEKRHDIVLTTKIGNHFDIRTKKWFWDPSPHYLRQAFENSLERLQTDYVDVLLLHGGTIDDPIDDIIETFERLMQEGKIRTYGISSIRPNVIREYKEKSQIDAVMMQYSLLDRRPEELFSMLQEKNISVLARGPLAKGILTESTNEYMVKKAPNGYEGYQSEELKVTLKALQQHTDSISSSAFRYVLHHPFVASAVFGARTINQLKMNLSHFSDATLSKVEMNTLQKITKTSNYTSHRFTEK